MGAGQVDRGRPGILNRLFEARLRSAMNSGRAVGFGTWRYGRSRFRRDRRGATPIGGLSSAAQKGLQAVRLLGKPFVTVSPVSGALPNNGADFGPDTPGTKTSGIQEAINSLPSAGGEVILLPGTFNLAFYVEIKTNGVRLQGANNASSMINIPASASWSLINGSGQNFPPAILIHDATDVTVEHLTVNFAGNSTGFPSGGFVGVVVGPNTTRTTIQSVVVNSTQLWGFQVSDTIGTPASTTETGNVADVYLLDCRAQGCGTPGKTNGGGLTIATPTGGDVISGIHVVRCKFLNSAFLGLDVGAPQGLFCEDCEASIASGAATGAVGFYIEGGLWKDLTFVRPVMNDMNRNAKYCMQINQGGLWITVIDAKFAGSTNAPLSIQQGQASGKGVRVFGGVFKNAGSGGSGIQIGPLASGTVDDVLIEGATCTDDQATPTQSYGIFLVSVGGSGGTQQIQHVRIAYCDLRGNATQGMWVASNNTRPAEPFNLTPSYSDVTVSSCIGMDIGEETQHGLGPYLVTPSVPASGIQLVNGFVFPVMILFTSAGSEALYAIFDQNGASITGLQVNAGTVVILQPGQSINIVYSTAPTWKWWGL